MSDCIFCKIVAGEIPSRTVYEDETTLAFLDAHPLAPGHTLVIPKAHYEGIGDTPPAETGDLFSVVGKLTPAVEAAVDAPASTVAVNNGEAAGQEVPHVHCHIIPRFEDDGAGAVHQLFAGTDLDEVEMETIAAAIREQR